MKLIFAVLDVSSTTGLTRRYKTEGFFYIYSAADRRDYVLERMFTKFSETTQCNGHYAVQRHSRSPISVSIKSSYTTSY